MRVTGWERFASAGGIRGLFSALMASSAIWVCDPLAAQSNPIVVASISSLVGDESTAEGVAAARAYFESINEAGGIRGRPIEYRVIDDRMDPATARKAVAQLVNDGRVVALAGGSSVMACSVTAEVLAQADLYDIPAGGVDADCFRSSHIVPVNTGPYASTQNALTYARRELKKSHLCVIVPDVPGESDEFAPTVTRWHRHWGGARPELFRYGSESALAALASSAAVSACEALVFVGPESAGIAWVKVFRSAWPSRPILLMTTSYASRTARELAGMGDGIYAMAEFDPWSVSSLSSADWRRLMLKNRLPLSSLSQGGYLAAQLLVKQLFAVQGPITRASVSEALRAMPAWNSGMNHTLLRVDARGNHDLNRSGLPMQLQQGRWRIAHPVWITNR